MASTEERDAGELAASGPVFAVRRIVELALTEGGLRPKTGRILVALSGGPDSRVLLDALVALAPRLDLTVEVCVVDHGLRHDSAREAQGALEVAGRLGVHAEVARVFPEDKSARAARDARYAALARIANERRLEAIALGHTATDQAETLLDHLLRGAGSRGLGAMAPKRMLGGARDAAAASALWLIRPLLDVSRAEVEAYLEAEGLSVVRDPTNDDLRYRRSRIRHRVLPLLREERPDLDRALTRLCERMRLDADYLEQAASAARRDMVVDETVDLEQLSKLHPALAARVLRELCEGAGVAGDRVPTDALLRLCRGRHGTSALDLPGGIVAERRYARLRIGPRGGAPLVEPSEVLLEKGGTVELGPLALRIPQALFKSGPLMLRRPRPGERVSGRRLADLLIDQKVARPDRARLWALAKPDGDAGHSKDGLTWVGLISAEAPGKISWEWPCKGTRPRPAAKPATKRAAKIGARSKR